MSAAEDARYPPISEHGLIGDLRTAALVSTGGRVDWFCAPRFDSPSVFGALLDADQGGSWELHPACEVVNRQQFYFPDTNILVTRFLTEDGMVEVQDFMPILRERDPDHRQRLVRRIAAIRGTVRMSTRVAPRFDYGRAAHETTETGCGVRFDGPGLALTLGGTVDLAVRDGDAEAEFSLAAGEFALLVLEVGEADCEPMTAADGLFDATVAYWRRWLAHSNYTGRWREVVHRSALTLKLLTHEPSGAIIAAPTCALPERIGGERNWDYRLVWIRDAAFSLYALLRLGFTSEAEDFIGWLTDRFDDPGDGELGPLRVMYTIDGDPAAGEEELPHLEGYRGSAPVRIGNDAGGQLQLDIYGELIDSVYLYNKHGSGISHRSWTNLTRVLDWLLANWDRPDEGIWETRAGRQRHTFSRLMCWVGIERMVRMARQRGLPADLPRWTAERDRIYHRIMDDCWDEGHACFSQREGEFVPDAAVLLMPMVKFCSPSDPRFLSTIDELERSLVVDSLVFRYDPDQAPDGLDGAEGTFSICSFWYVEALARSGQVDKARLSLEKMFTYANHLGLYAEQIGLTGEQLGNFPQAFTHLSLISSAINTDRALPG
ncbi:glycoside hydrolase family 15 protein [Saccharopolyspora sp. NPDC047091]|uniref:glycoside hydrolase family 15 protein n=1 Tax=Saccharopolyspora sp. NPDC047091 TaxID=3155924 RepID=UPI0033D669AA